MSALRSKCASWRANGYLRGRGLSRVTNRSERGRFVRLFSTAPVLFRLRLTTKDHDFNAQDFGILFGIGNSKQAADKILLRFPQPKNHQNVCHSYCYSLGRRFDIDLQEDLFLESPLNLISGHCMPNQQLDAPELTHKSAHHNHDRST